MLLVRICWGPARGRFAGSGGFGFRILDFEFVWDFDIGISDFPFWLRAQPALGVRVGVRVRVRVRESGGDCGATQSVALAALWCAGVGHNGAFCRRTPIVQRHAALDISQSLQPCR